MAVSDVPAGTPAIDGMNTLVSRMADANTTEEWSFILSDYIKWGNTKLANSIAVFNMGSATDCVNRGTDHCQVGENECYAVKSENRFAHVEEHRDRSEYVWDSLDPETFADAFLAIVSRKQNEVKALRFNVAGDFRVQGDVVRVNEIAKRLTPHGIAVYTYSASDYLDFGAATHYTVNASNPDVDGDQRYEVVESEEQVPDDGFLCPSECGPCQACFYPGGGDIYEVHK